MILNFGLLISAAAIPALAGYSAPQNGMRRWIVTFAPDIRMDGRIRALAAGGITAVAQIGTNGSSRNEFSAAVIDMPEGENPARFLSAANGNSDEIVAVEPDERFDSAALEIPAGALEGNFGGFLRGASVDREVAAIHARPASEVQWDVEKLDPRPAWKVTKGGGVRVAVIDSGINFNISDMRGRVVGGYSAVTKTESPDDYMDVLGHGTGVAAVIAANLDGRGVAGVAPEADLLAVRVFEPDPSDHTKQTASISNVIDGIVWAVKNGAKVINLSMSIDKDSPALHAAIRQAFDQGIVVVAAAGNTFGGRVQYPAAYPEVLAVGALDQKNHLAKFSASPGAKNGMFVVPGQAVGTDGVSGEVKLESGTSLAAPHVAGLAALAIAMGFGSGGVEAIRQKLYDASEEVEGGALPNARSLAESIGK